MNFLFEGGRLSILLCSWIASLQEKSFLSFLKLFYFQVLIYTKCWNWFLRKSIAAKSHILKLLLQSWSQLHSRLTSFSNHDATSYLWRHLWESKVVPRARVRDGKIMKKVMLTMKKVSQKEIWYSLSFIVNWRRFEESFSSNHTIWSSKCSFSLDFFFSSLIPYWFTNLLRLEMHQNSIKIITTQPRRSYPIRLNFHANWKVCT